MNVFGYLDPGSGTLIVQALLGGAAGVAVLFKTMGSRFRRTRKAETPVEEPDYVEAEDPAVPTQFTE